MFLYITHYKMESFSIYQEAIESSSVTHSILGRFSSQNEELLLARHTSIELYSLGEHMKLICRYPIYGEVDSIARLSHSKHETDLLLIACKEAKITTLLFSPLSNTFSVSCLHSFEDEKRSQEVDLQVDPDNRCFGGRIAPNRFVIVPVKTSTKKLSAEVEAYNHCWMGHDIYYPAFIIDIPLLPRSLCFISGLTDPQLVVLYSKNPTQTKITLDKYSINLRRKEMKLISSVSDLCPDSHTIVPLAAPLIGTLVLGARSILYCRDSNKQLFELDLLLEGSQHTFFNAHRLLCILYTGEMYVFAFNYTAQEKMYVLDDRSDTVNSITPIPVLNTFETVPSCVVCFGDIVFVGSRMGDSLLLKLQGGQVAPTDDINLMMMEDDESLNPYKKRKLYIESLEINTLKLDELQGISGATSCAVLNRTRTDGETVRELMICCGYGKSSSIKRLSLSVLPLKQLTFDQDTFDDIEQITALFSIRIGDFDGFLLISRNDSTMILNTREAIEDVTDSTGFLSKVETINAGRVCPGIIFQAHSSGIRYLNESGDFLKDSSKSNIFAVSSYGEYFGILDTDSSLETFQLFPDLSEKPLPKIPGIITAFDLTILSHNKVICVGRPDGSLQLYYMLTGSLILTCGMFSEGPSLIIPEDALDCSITDPTQKLHIAPSPATACIVELLFKEISGVIVLAAKLSNGEISIYQGYSEFKFTRICPPLYLGPMEYSFELSRHLFIIQDMIFVIHTNGCCWIVPDSKHNTLRVFSSSGVFESICSFHHPVCDHGFFYKENNKLHIARIEDDILACMKTMPCIAIKKKFTETPKQIIVHKNYIIVAFFTDKGVIHYSLKMFNIKPEGDLRELCIIPHLNDNEVIQSMCVATFNRKLNPPFEYLAIGTGIITSEDQPCHGRLLLFSIRDNRLVHQPLQKVPGLKGPVSALACVDGYLLVGVNPELKVFTFVDREEEEAWLEPIAFHYGYSMASGMDIVGNDILIAEPRNHMYTLKYEEGSNKKNLELQGQFFREQSPTSASFHFNRQVISDENRNILIYYDNPTLKKIEKIGDFHTALTVYAMARAEASLLMPSIEGGLGALFICNEVIYKKMHTLQNALLESLPYRAGMNPRSYRQCTSYDKDRYRKSVLDRQLVFSYCYLSQPIQRSIARNIGTTPQHILSELAELPAAHHFL